MQESTESLQAAAEHRQAVDRRHPVMATDVGQALPDSLFHQHETDANGRVTWCPMYALTGEERNHQVRADGVTVSCHPARVMKNPELDHG